MEIIVILGSSLNKGQLSDENIGRLETALEVYNAKIESTNNRIVFIVSGSGLKPTSTIKITEAEAMSNYLILQGVPAETIISESSSNNTIENIINTTLIIKQLLNQGERIISITYVSSDYHIPRIVKILEYFGVPGIELFASGSKVYPKSRITQEKEIMKSLDQILLYYAKK